MIPIPAILFGEPGLTGLALASLIGGLLTLDDTALGQTWFSQPLPAGLLAGLALGDVQTGLALGLPLQLVMAANIPVGQSFTGDAVPATVGVVAAAVLAEQAQRPALLHGSAGLPLLGWLLVAVAVLSIAGQWSVQAERRANTAWMLQGHRTLRDGDLGRIGRLHLRCLAATGLRGVAATALTILLVLKFWIPLFERLPARGVTACGLLALLLPGLGLGALVEQYGMRRAGPWLVMGAAVSGAVWGVMSL